LRRIFSVGGRALTINKLIIENMANLNCIKIHKVYTTKYTYVWTTEKVILTEEELFRYELCSPYWRNTINYVVGVGRDSGYLSHILNMNPVATELFNTPINGDIIIHFEFKEGENSEEKFNVCCNILKYDLLKLGCSVNSIKY
jgi:hypothetical protein